MPTESSSIVLWEANKEYKVGTLVKTSAGNIYQVVNGTTGTSQPSSVSKDVIIMDGTIRIVGIGEYEDGWRVPGNSYVEGDTINDSTFVVQCIKGGATNPASQWGPTESAVWRDDDTIEDGNVVWKRLTKTSDEGVWRNSNSKYPDGIVFLCSSDPVPAGKVRIYKSLPGISGDTEPTDTTGNDFLDGSVTLCFKQKEDNQGNTNIDIPYTDVNDIDNEGIEPDIYNATPWKGETSYDLGQCVISNGNIYSCAYDGRVTLFRRATFENVTTNIKTATVFTFLGSTDVPTRQSYRPCQVIVRNCDAITTIKKGAETYFGHAGNPDIEVKIVND